MAGWDTGHGQYSAVGVPTNRNRFFLTVLPKLYQPYFSMKKSTFIRSCSKMIFQNTLLSKKWPVGTPATGSTPRLVSPPTVIDFF
jgi:hypothetical protein